MHHYKKYHELMNSGVKYILWHRQAIYDTFEVFYNFDVIVCDHYEYFKMCLEAYYHFIDDDREIQVVDYREYFDNDKIAFRTVHDIRKRVWMKYDLKDPFKKLKSLPKKNKWITTSLIERKYWPGNIAYLEDKGFQEPDAQLFESILSTHPDFVNVGDSRSFESAEELIEKLQIIRDSRMYVGSCCAWSNWASENGVPTYIFFNARTGAEHHYDTLLRDILPNLRKGYVRTIPK